MTTKVGSKVGEKHRREMKEKVSEKA